jgi:hypothetical protein
MDLTDPRFIQAFMASKESKASNIPTVFNKLMQASKSMKETYQSEKYFLESQFEQKQIPVYLELVKLYQLKQDEDIRNQIYDFINSLSEYEMYLLTMYYENQLFGLRKSAIDKSLKLGKSLTKRELYALMKRQIFLDQSVILKDLIDLGIPVTLRVSRYLNDNMYVFADILARNKDQLITGYDLNVYTYPLDKYRNYYYKLFYNDSFASIFYGPNKDLILDKIKTYLSII